jgi:hypothetical protein
MANRMNEIKIGQDIPRKRQAKDKGVRKSRRRPRNYS